MTMRISKQPVRAVLLALAAGLPRAARPVLAAGLPRAARQPRVVRPSLAAVGQLSEAAVVLAWEGPLRRVASQWQALVAWLQRAASPVAAAWALRAAHRLSRAM